MVWNKSNGMHRAIDERDNLNAALEQAAKKDIEAGLYLSSRLQDLWKIFDIRLGLFWLNLFLKCPGSVKYPYARAKALCAQGWILLWLEQLPQARGPAEESLALYQACNDRTGEFDALTLLGTTYYNIGDQAEGNKIYQQALTVSQSLGDVWRQAIAYSHLSDDHSDLQRSFDYYDKAVELFDAAGDRRSQAEVFKLDWSVSGFKRRRGAGTKKSG